MNDKERVLKWCRYEERWTSSGYYRKLIGESYEWRHESIIGEDELIAAISTRFAELGMKCFLIITEGGANVMYYKTEGVLSGPGEWSTRHTETCIGHGATPYEAWFSAALNECKEG